MTSLGIVAKKVNQKVNQKENSRAGASARLSMRLSVVTLVILSAVMFISLSVSAKSVGRKAAEKYMKQKPDLSESSEDSGGGGSPAVGDAARYLQLYGGGFLSDKTYKWDSSRDKNVGNWFVGVSYRMGEWVKSADFLMRFEYQTYTLASSAARKISIVPMITFPDANSRFPLYFGFGLGPGIFVKQAARESAISLDYQLVMGLRLFELIDSAGFFLEGGIKDHILLLSDVQFAEGVFLSSGAVFTF
jgi:hypothetical protein